MADNSLTDDLPGFDDPVALLRACHDKMLAHCLRLEKLVAHLDEHGVDEAARKAAGDISRYFSTAAVLHHRDEEEDLFPLLNRQSLKIAELVHRLKQEHLRQDALWREIAADLGSLPGGGFSETARQGIAAFCQLLRAHVQVENTEFLPLAANSLSTRVLEEIGQAMAERRGIKRQEPVGPSPPYR